MNETLFITILLVHFLSDFGLQTHDQAVQKSYSWKMLFYHVGGYSLIWFLMSYVVLNNIFLSFLFTLITFVCHFITDAITSRTSKKFFDKKDYHNGFVVIGADQMLHYLQLWYTFQFIFWLK
jgi:hypothetical protein